MRKIAREELIEIPEDNPLPEPEQEIYPNIE